MDSYTHDGMYCRLFLLLVLWNVNSWALAPVCPLCVTKDLSCSKQMEQMKEEDCTMVYYPLDSLECSSRNLLEGNHRLDLGNVRLRSYIYTQHPYTQTAFNVSFSNISWSNLSMRFMQNHAPGKNTCRDFRVSKDFSLKEAPLFYDCLWSGSEYEGKTFNFEYVASNGLSSQSHKYVFIVPRGDRIKPLTTKLSNWEVFMYVDISSSQMVILKAQTVPKHFNVTKYLVKVHSGSGGDDSVIKDEKLITTTEIVDEITFTWNLGILHGSYYFTVQPLSASCPESKCLISNSPVITINTPYNPIYAGIVLAAVSLLILLCFCFKIFGSKGHESPSQPSLLLIYQSTHLSHIKVVVELAKYLRNNCNIHAMVDELDVNRSRSQDPFDWYNGAVSEADFIAVVSSPTCCNSINGIYPKAYDNALFFLRGSAFKRENFAKKCKLMVFMLPYGSKRDLPQETKNIGLHFQIPSHVMDVSRYIHNYKEMYFYERYYYFVQARVKFLWNFIKNKNCVDNACDWPEVQKAIQEAIVEINRCERSKGNTDLRVDYNQQPSNISHKSQGETGTLGDGSVMDSSTPPVDNVNGFSGYTFSLENIELLGSNQEIVDTDNLDSRDHSLNAYEL